MGSERPASVEKVEQACEGSARRVNNIALAAATGPGPHEPVKQLIRGPWLHNLIMLATHAPALAISAALISLNSAPTFWFGASPDFPVTVGSRSVSVSVTNVLHLLQVAAKASELLIIFSLSTITLDIYRGMLVTTGLPLGLITAGYRTGSLIYLKHSALLSAIGVHRRYLFFGLFVVFGTLLSILSGPACAILMVPTPGWYPASHDYATIKPPVLYMVPRSSVWPLTLQAPEDHPSGRNDCFDGIVVEANSFCPGAGLNQVINSLIRGRVMMDENITVSSPSAGSFLQYQVYAARGPSSSNDSATFATTSSIITGRALHAYLNFVKTNPTSTLSLAKDFRIRTLDGEANYQPLVQVKCHSFDHEIVLAAARRGEKNSYPYWPMEGVECFDDIRCAAWQNRSTLERLVDAKYWNDTPPVVSSPFNSSFRWVETEGPLSAIFRMPYLVSARSGPPDNFTQGHYILACSLVSRWVPSVTTIRLPESNVLQSNVTDPTVYFSQSTSSSSETLGEGYSIQVDRSWAEYLNYNKTKRISQGDDDTTQNRTLGMMDWFFQRLTACFQSKYIPITLCTTNPTVPQEAAFAPALERALGMVMADGLSRVSLSSHDANLELAAIHEKMCVEVERSTERLAFVYLMPQSFFFDGGWPRNFSITPSSPNDTSSTVLRIYTQGNKFYDEHSNLTMAQWTASLCSFQAYGLVAERYGYGTGTPSRTLVFALIVTSLCITVIFANSVLSLGIQLYQILRGSRSKTGAVVGWTDIQDLMTLALKSKNPRGLDNTGAGVRPFSRIWTQIASVRANEEACLELVVGDGDCGRKPERGKLYG